MKRLIINADDFNLTPGCDRAIRLALNAGAVTSASCLIWGKGEAFPGRMPAMGVHLRLTDGEPVLRAKQVPSLVDRQGKFATSQQACAQRHVDPEEVRREWKAQIESFLFWNNQLTHLDSHHHVHSLLALWDVYADLCKQFDVAGVALSQRQRYHLRAHGVKCADYAEIRWTDGKWDSLQRLLHEDFAAYETVHLMTHPGSADDEELAGRSSMTTSRAAELELLTSENFAHWLNAEQIERVDMEALKHEPDPLAKVDIIFLAWNRREFTVESLKYLRLNTDWSRVRRVLLYDDGSVDGTLEELMQFATGDVAPFEAWVIKTETHSPVAIMNDYLEKRHPAAWFAKIDNDVVLPPGWLTTCLDVLRENPSLDLLGIEAMYPAALDGARVAEPCGHIGGIGLMRTAAFKELPVAAGRLGFSDWQVKHDVVKAWLNPSLPVVLLDRLPIKPWSELSQQYEAKNWQRPWKRYAIGENVLWNWWLKL
jgi:predicted glycoside hydrolase/deacetylase ChbG (UPF0249 family)